jgi:N-acetylmuramoyl-L-alanine amidase
MRPLTEIIVHCTATRPNWMAGQHVAEKVAEVRRWHVQDRGWNDIGYHYLIDRDGTVAPGRPLDKVGAHTQGRNTGTVGIALFGGHGSAKNDPFAANFTPEQERALRDLIARLKAEYPTIKKVSGHNQFANKACPGFNVPTWYAEKPAPVERTSPVQSTTVQASAVQIASGAGAGIAALGALDGTAQIIALAFAAVVILAGAWVFRERLRKWAEGDR